MRDAILFADIDVPSIALITELFWEQSAFVASGVGMPDIPRIRLPYPVAGTDDDTMQRIAADVANTVLRRLVDGSIG